MADIVDKLHVAARMSRADHSHCQLMEDAAGVIKSLEDQVTRMGTQFCELRTEVYKAWELVANARSAGVSPYAEMSAPMSVTIVSVNKSEIDALLEMHRRVAKLAGMT